jgi:hypothetical protein
MGEFAILSNRKRALIALIHSLFFLVLAVRGFASPKAAASFHGSGHVGGILTLAIYGIVVTVLAWLAWISRCARERIYFLLCVGSASFGFIRTLLGDPAVPAAQYLRVVMIVCAVVVGIWIFRGHAEDPLLS